MCQHTIAKCPRLVTTRTQFRVSYIFVIGNSLIFNKLAKEKSTNTISLSATFFSSILLLSSHIRAIASGSLRFIKMQRYTSDHIKMSIDIDTQNFTSSIEMLTNFRLDFNRTRRKQVPILHPQQPKATLNLKRSN